MKSLNNLRVRSEDHTVILEVDGRGRRMSWQKADEIATAIRAAARKAEEHDCANRIIADHALMTRAGCNIGLSNHPKILEEVRKESVWNRMLRRFLPHREVKAVFGTPTITRRPPNADFAKKAV